MQQRGSGNKQIFINDIFKIGNLGAMVVMTIKNETPQMKGQDFLTHSLVLVPTGQGEAAIFQDKNRKTVITIFLLFAKLGPLGRSNQIIYT